MKKWILTLLMFANTVFGYTNFNFGASVFQGSVTMSGPLSITDQPLYSQEIQAGLITGDELSISAGGGTLFGWNSSEGLYWAGLPATGPGSGITDIHYTNITYREWVYTGGELAAAHQAISSPQGWFMHTGGGFTDYFNMNCARVIHTSSGGVVIALPSNTKGKVVSTMICSKGEQSASNLGAGDIVFTFATRSSTNYPPDWQGSGPAVTHYSGYVERTVSIGAGFPWMWNVTATNQFAVGTGPKFLIIQRKNSTDTYETNIFVHSLLLQEIE